MSNLIPVRTSGPYAERDQKICDYAFGKGREAYQKHLTGQAFLDAFSEVYVYIKQDLNLSNEATDQEFAVLVYGCMSDGWYAERYDQKCGFYQSGLRGLLPLGIAFVVGGIVGRYTKGWM